MVELSECVILSACRTPIGAFGGALREVSAVDLGAHVVGEAVRPASVEVSAVDEVILGCRARPTFWAGGMGIAMVVEV